MSERSRKSRFQPVEIGKVNGVRAVIQAVPDTMTAHAGVGMIAEVERRVGLLAELAKRVHDRRVPHMCDHSTSDILMQRTCQIAIGFPDGNDADFLRFDPAILQCLDRHPAKGKPAASQETISRFGTNALNDENSEHAQDLYMDHFLKHNRKRPKRLELDLDGSMIKTYGAQEGAIFRGGKYDHEMYFPLFGFISGWLVAATLRTGDAGESSTVLPTLKKIVARLRSRWRGVPITVRLDAAFGSPELYRWCRENRVDYEIALRATSALKWHAYHFMVQAEEEFRKEFGELRHLKRDGTKDGDKAHAEHVRVRMLEDKEERMDAERERCRRRVRVVGEFYYKSESWDNWERVIVRVDCTDTGLDVRFVMVSYERGWPKPIYEEQYCQRGLMEQFIGKFKQTGQRLSAQTLMANQFRMIEYAAAYMLLFHLQQYLVGNLERCDVNTLRKTLMLMPARIRCTEKKLVTEVSERHAHCKQFLAAWRRLVVA